MLVYIIILVTLIILAALFSAIETALMSISKIKVNSLLKEEKAGAEALHRIKQNPHKTIITILIGNNLVIIGSSALATVIFTEIFGSGGVGLATGVMTIVILAFGEISPKTYASQNSERIALSVARPVEVLSIILSPAVKIFEVVSQTISKLFGSKGEQELSEEELRTIVTMGRDEGILSKEAAEIMQNVLEFEGTKVTEIMIPEVNIEMIDGEKELREVIDKISELAYSRYPVFLGKRDNIAGILDVGEVLKYSRKKKLDMKVKNIMGDVHFVPESKEIDDLLTEFEGKRIPLAIVVDEYGSVSGLVTMEDILEEVVGDIFDKSKRRTLMRIKPVDEKLIRVDAQATVEEVNKVLNLGLAEGQFDTIAGFIEHKLQRIPKKGEQIQLKNVTIEVDDVTKRGITGVKIVKK